MKEGNKMAFTIEELQELAKVAETAEQNGELGGDFKKLKDGEYLGIITDAILTESKKGQSMVRITLEVTEDDEKGSIHNEFLMLEADDYEGKPSTIPLWNMKKIGDLARDLKIIDENLSDYDFQLVLSSLVNCYVTFTIQTKKGSTFPKTTIYANK